MGGLANWDGPRDMGGGATPGLGADVFGAGAYAPEGLPRGFDAIGKSAKNPDASLFIVGSWEFSGWLEVLGGKVCIL